VIPYNIKLKGRSRKLRADMTDAERVLWSRIRRKQIKGVQFYRQKPVGNYIVDFYCPKAKLIIEVDGGYHKRSEIMQNDHEKDKTMNELGFTVLRFSNDQVMNHIEHVLEEIKRVL